jgi:hypothetical protein
MIHPFSIVLLAARCGARLDGMRTHQPASATSRGNSFDTQFLRRHFTKVVIQEIPTRRYWQTLGVWTSNIEAARTYDSCTKALEEALFLKLKNVQLVLNREFKEWEIIPIKTSISPRPTAPGFV